MCISSICHNYILVYIERSYDPSIHLLLCSNIHHYEAQLHNMPIGALLNIVHLHIHDIHCILHKYLLLIYVTVSADAAASASICWHIVICCGRFHHFKILYWLWHSKYSIQTEATHHQNNECNQNFRHYSNRTGFEVEVFDVIICK